MKNPSSIKQTGALAALSLGALAVNAMNSMGFSRPLAVAGRFSINSRSGVRLLLATALAAVVSVLVPLPSSAATITWGTATTISYPGDSDVITSGTSLYAYAGGITTATTNLNGVTFTAGSGFAAWGNVTFTSGFTTYTASAFAVGASFFTDLSPAYQAVLKGGAYGGASAGTVTLNGLTPGHDYAVQIWVNDSRATAKTETINGSSVTLDYNNYDAVGGLGQYVVGYFTADNTTQAFAMTPSASGTVQLNAISVRDEGLAQRTWLGSSDTSWGTAGNWSPANTPFPGDAITFNELSTANQATMLDASYTVSTITLSNAPAAVSIGSDGNTLTINSGINLFGAGDNLTINDAVVLGNFQTWTNYGIMTVNANISGSAALNIAGNGVATFTQPATYLYKTTISGGSLKLSGSGSLTSANIVVAGGATFDVSAVAGGTYYLSSVTLSNSSAGAVLNGNLDCSSGAFSMAYDGVNASFIQKNGVLTLSSSTAITINIPGTVLGAGTYTVIAAGSAGNVSGSLPSVILTGNGTVGAASLQIDGSGNLQLVVNSVDVWTGASDNLWTTAGNWTPSGGPSANPGDAAVFDTASTANLSTVLNSDINVLGVSVLNPAGPVTIGGANSLTVYGNGLNLSAANQDLTITAPLVLNASQNWIVTNSRTLTISGNVSGSASIGVVGGGTVKMGATGVLNGLTNSAPSSASFNLNSTLDLNGTAQAINGLNGSGVVDNTAVGAATLTVGGNGDSSSNNIVIQNTGGALTLQVAGGDVQLLGTNTYSGGTIFNGGRLYFPKAAALGTGPVTFNPGSGAYTLGVTFTNSLTLNGAYLQLGGGGYPNLVNQTWSGPVTVVNGFSMSGDNQGCTLTLSGPMNIGTGGISVTNFGNNGPQEGYQVSLTGDLLSGPISGSGGITYNLSGANSRLTVQGANTYSGGTIVNGDPANPGGKLNVWGSVNPFSTGAVTLNANAIIESAPGSVTITNALTLNGGTLQSEPQFNNYNTLTWSGPITLTADSTLVQYASGALNNNQSSGVNVSGSLNMNGFTLTCSSPVACYNGNILSGSISGAGTILENGNNNLTVSGSNTFSGTFRSVVGNLSVQNAYALQNATLDMNAADAGSVNLNNLNHVIGALTGSRNLALGSGTVSIGNNNATTTYDGILSGGASLTKVGLGTVTLTGNNTYGGSTTVNGGTLELSGANSYAGNTTVNAGTLIVDQPSFAFSSTVTVAGGAFLNLNAATTNVVTALVLNGVSQPNGVYNAANSGGRITGTGAIQVGITPDVWTGALSSEWSVNVLSSPYNWKYNGVGTNYTDGSAVQFDDTAANTTVDISVANVTPVGVIFNNTNSSYTVSGSSGIAGTATLTKNGTNSVTLLNNNAFSGNTTINAGTVIIGGGGSLGGGTYAGAIAIATNAILDYNSTVAQTLAGGISGLGGLTFDTTNGTATTTLTLSGVNNYSGVTTIGNGNNSLNRITAGTGISPNTTFNILGGATGGGQLFINLAGTVFANNFILSGVGNKDIGGSTINYVGAIRLSNNDSLSGTITLAGNSRIGFIGGGASATVSGRITGSYGLDLYGCFNTASTTQTFTLANTGPANDYTGNTTIYNNYYNGSSAGNNTVLKLGANEQIPNGSGKGNVVFSNNSGNVNRLNTFEMNGFSETVNGISGSNPTTGTEVIQNTTTGASILTIGDADSSSAFSGNIKDGGAGKTLAITKIGSGTLTLSGANTYNGGTAINGGTLLINNATGSTGTGTNAVNINSGGTLGGTGFITGLVTNNAGGILSPGGVSGVGKLTLSGNVTLLAGSTSTFLVNGTTAVASNSVAVGAAITYGGVLNIVTNGTFTSGQTFQLFSGTGATNASNFASIAGSPGAGLAFNFTNGVLSVVTASVGPSGPATLTHSISGNNLLLSWPAGQGWRLQMQTNSLSTGLNTNWIYISDGTLSSTNITVDNTKPTVFYRLTYP